MTVKKTTEPTTAVPQKTANEAWTENQYSRLLKPPTGMPIYERLRIYAKLRDTAETIGSDAQVSQIAESLADIIEWLRDNAAAVPVEEFDKTVIGMGIDEVPEFVLGYTNAVGE